MSNWEYVADTKRVGDLIVQVVADMHGEGSNPRDDDNVSCIYGQHRHYTIGDGEPPADELRALDRGGVGLLYRWLRRYKGVVAFTKLGMYDHSGITVYSVGMGGNGHHMFDDAGWDSGIVGYAYVSRENWTKCCGDSDPLAPVDGERAIGMGKIPVIETAASHALEQDIDLYDSYVKGEVWGYVVTKPCADEHHEGDDDDTIAACPHSDILDSCWGFVGEDKYAMEEGVSVAQWHVDHAQAS